LKPEEVLGFVKQNLGSMISGEIEFRDAAKYVQTEYADVMSNSYLKDLFFLEENKRRQSGDNRSYRELYKAIGDDLRQAFKLPVLATNQPAPAPTTLAARRDDKLRTTPPTPRTTASRLDAPAASKPPSQVDVLNQMRAARRQTPIN